MRRLLRIGVLASLARPAWAGEIIIIDPAREKAQMLPQPTVPRHDDQRARALDEARAWGGRETERQRMRGEEETVPPALERAREARGYIDAGVDAPAPSLIIKSGPPPTDASVAREKARSWIVSPAADNASRCKTENTVGGIEGTAQGHTVIQGTASDVNTICK